MPYHTRFLIAAVVGFMAVGIADSKSYGQEKYTPDHPEVRALAQEGQAYLRRGKTLDDVGEAIITALAVCECDKRYTGKIPGGDKTVIAAVKGIQEKFFTSTGEVRDLNTIYAPSLAVILLCLVDDEKYAGEINAIMQYLYDRQLPGGSWGYSGQTIKDLGDTSQIQYACLALFMAKQTGIKIDYKVAKRALDWLMDTQYGDGRWSYRQVTPLDPRHDRGPSHSLCAAGLGGVYMMSNVLQADSILKGAAKNKRRDGDLPKSVVEYVEPNSDVAKDLKILAEINQSKLRVCTQRGNEWFANNFTVSAGSWPYYYLYGFERYAYFRETAEGGVLPEMPTWYDQGVEYLKANKDPQGFWDSSSAAHSVDNKVTTAFAVLFLVRSTELLAGDPRAGDLRGGKGFGTGELRVRSDGSIVGKEIERNVTEMLKLLEENPEMDLDDYTSAMTKLVVADDSEQKRKTIDTMRSWVNDFDSKRRFIAVKVLSLSRDLESVPALIHAMSDPLPEIAVLAHDGLRFISRKIDSIRLPKNPDKANLLQVKKQWEEWYLNAKPNGRLYQSGDSQQ